MSDQTREYDDPKQPGRFDVNGVEWWACDPYPTWYRWEGDTLLTDHAAWPVTDTSTPPVMAIDQYPTNGHLIAACARLGYLRKEWRTLDPTYGLGVFWSVWQPDELFGHDLDPKKSLSGQGVDATNMPYADRSFDSVVIDGPYKLNGTPTEGVDHRYGVQEPTRWQDRMDLLGCMMREGARVLGNGFLLFKCQDQVVSGKVRWQTQVFTNYAEECGLGLVDRLDYLSYRPQPNGVRQVTARRNASTMLVFKRGWNSA